MPFARLLIAACIVLLVAWMPPARSETTTQAMPEYMDMLQHAIAMQTVEGKDQVPAFARYLAGKLEAAGFAKSDIEIIPVGRTAALVVHYRGTGKGKPILISAHMDVVAANPADWDRDPFKLVREGDYYYGRGIADMKDNTVALVETFMRLKREGFTPARGMILVFSGDEETDMASTRELARRHHDAEFLLNADAGGGTYDANGKPVLYEVQAAEKTYADFRLTVTAPGGHSSEPDPPQNPIYRLARALERIDAYHFPVKYNDITLASFKAIGAHGSDDIAKAMRQFAADPGNARAAAVITADPAYVGQIRTTCVATMIGGGHALNALPSRATANVNCRIFPGTSVASVKATLAKVVDDASIAIDVRPPPPVESPASPLRPDVMGAVRDAIHARFPGLDVTPGMSSGATDSMYFRNAGVPSYGVNPDFAKPNDTHAHGVDEKLPASELEAGLEYWHRLLTRLSME